MSDYLTLDYTQIDYETLKERLKDQIRDSEIFEDVDYEGSNISVLIQLFAYVSELNTFYSNKIAKNSFLETANLYETVHSLAKQIGYDPRGYVSSSGTISVSVSGSGLIGKRAVLEEWKAFSTSSVKDDDGNPIYFVTVAPQAISPTLTDSVTFSSVPVKQGKIVKYTNDTTDPYRKDDAFTGSDLVENKLYLPFLNFGYDNNLLDEYESIRVFVDGTEWTRITDFFDDISGLTANNQVFTFKYNKRKDYIITFSSLRTVPSDNSTIEIWLLESLGKDGNVGVNSVDTVVDSNVISADGVYLNNSGIHTVTNSSIIDGGSDPETISTIRSNAKSTAFTQYRSVTKDDYELYLSQKSDILKATAWGEQEQNPLGGNVYDYNKIYISLIPSDTPSEWTSLMTMGTYTTPNGETLYVPGSSFNSSYTSSISTWLEPRKMIGSWEEYVAPSLVYLYFYFGVVINPLYRYPNVLTDLKAKLSYYFNASNRDFGETIDFVDIKESMMDSEFVDSTNNLNFTNTRGIRDLIIRDIKYFDVITSTFIDPYAYTSIFYPKFSQNVATGWDDNNLRNVLLNFNQFPFISINDCVFVQEGV